MTELVSTSVGSIPQAAEWKRGKESLEPKPYYAQKEQLLAKIDSLIRELEQLRQSGQKECILAVTNLLEKRLLELTALRQATATGNRWRQ